MCYAVLKYNREIEIHASDHMVTKLKLSYFDGMIGAIPVFDTQENAEKHANGECMILELNVECDPV